MGPTGLPVLQVGFGGFGPVHLQAWLRLGFGDRLWVADPDPAARARVAAFNLPAERVVADFRDVLDRVGLVDVVAATDRHREICEAALAAGKDVFAEKPLTLDLAGSLAIAGQVAPSARILQVGYYFRHHPLARYARAAVEDGALGELRYLAARFIGYKRARRDSGATGNDAVHFLDLFNWLKGTPPDEVYAVQRDHFGRGFDDLALILLTWPDGTVGKIEAGYIVPGRWTDTIVPGAQATKEMTVCGSAGALEIDFHIERLIWHRVRHERHADGLWRPVFEDAITPALPAAGPVDVVASELEEFLGHVARRTTPEANASTCGVEIARLLEAIGQSARSGRPVCLADA
jgi:predicted dehydrogenase